MPTILVTALCATCGEARPCYVDDTIRICHACAHAEVTYLRQHLLPEEYDAAYWRAVLAAFRKA